jgi:DNA-binding HxlR family transcriptional regulator
LRILSRKWSYFVLRAMASPSTFGELKEELHYVTNRMLSLELRKLASDGLIVHQDSRYARTDAGDDLLRAVENLAAWSSKHMQCRTCASQMRCSMCAGYPPTVRVRGAGTKV